MGFSLIIPSYNNSKELSRELPLLLQWLKNVDQHPEVIVVNDGSEQAEELTSFCSKQGILLLHHEKNQGKGAAIRTGMLAATGEICIFTDADIPFQYDIFPSILEAFKDPNISIVAGDRRRSDYFSKTPAIRRFGSNIFSMLVNIIMLRNLGDTQCGIKAFRAVAVKKIFTQSYIKGFAADIEWLFIASKENLRIHWVNAEFRNAGESSVVFWKQAILMLVDVLSLRFGLLRK